MSCDMDMNGSNIGAVVWKVKPQKIPIQSKYIGFQAHC